MKVTYCGVTYCFEPKGLVPVCSTLLPAFSAILPVEKRMVGMAVFIVCLRAKVRGGCAPSELDSPAILE